MVANRPEPTEIWVAISINPIEHRCNLLDIGEVKSEVEASGKNQMQEHDVHFGMFNLLDSELGQQMYDWFGKCGIPLLERIHLVNSFVKTITELATEAQEELSE